MRTAVAVVVGLLSSYSVSDSIAQTVQLEQSPGLKRFDKSHQLGVLSKQDIKSVHIGDNVLAKAMELQKQGGEVHYITGGSRSRKVNISFYQPYQDSRLDQRFELHFDKDKGFISEINVTYKLDSAYLDIQPVQAQVLKGALGKYGEPLSMQQVQDLANVNLPEVPIARFVDKFSTDDKVMGEVKQFFENKIITPKARFTASQEGRALLISGFRECYFWAEDDFAELISLCSFRGSSGNQKGQGIELTLQNFNIREQIAQYTLQPDDQLTISF